MTENRQNVLTSLQVLVCVAKADGNLSDAEQSILREAWEQLQPAPEGVTLQSLLTADQSLAQLLQNITTPDAQRAVYDAARSLAEQDSIQPAQQQLLNQIHATFRTSILDSSQSEASVGVNADTVSDTPPYKALITGIQVVSQHNCKARNLIFDYALGAAVIALIPIVIPGIWVIRILTLIVLIFKMRRDLAALWGFPKGHDILARVGSGFGCLGALAVALMAWLTMSAIGAFVPYINSLALAAAFATLTWATGQLTNQFYFSSGRMDQIAFQRMLQRSAQPQRHKQR